FQLGQRLIPLALKRADLSIRLCKFSLSLVPLLFRCQTRRIGGSESVLQMSNLAAQLLLLPDSALLRRFRRLPVVFHVCELGICFLQTRVDGFLFFSFGSSSLRTLPSAV